ASSPRLCGVRAWRSSEYWFTVRPAPARAWSYSWDTWRAARRSRKQVQDEAWLRMVAGPRWRAATIGAYARIHGSVPPPIRDGTPRFRGGQNQARTPN